MYHNHLRLQTQREYFAVCGSFLWTLMYHLFRKCFITGHHQGASIIYFENLKIFLQQILTLIITLGGLLEQMQIPIRGVVSLQIFFEIFKSAEIPRGLQTCFKRYTLLYGYSPITVKNFVTVYTAFDPRYRGNLLLKLQFFVLQLDFFL